jgi:predicted DNA-binding ribbon-helix-helix protein
MKSRRKAKSPIPKRTAVIAGQKTSVSLEDQFWEALKDIAKERGSTLQDLVTSIKAEPRNPLDLSIASIGSICSVGPFAPKGARMSAIGISGNVPLDQSITGF